MNPEERIHVGEMWLAIASMHGKDIAQPALKLMLDAVSDIPGPLLMRAIRECLNDPKMTSYPLPGKLRDMVYPQANPKDLARDTAVRIRQAVTKFGWPNPSDAKAFIGEAGWRAVERFGGWKYICENLGVEIQESIFFAQVRDVLESDMNLEKAGIDQSRPSIEQARERSQIQSAGEIINQLGIKPKTIEGKV